VKFMRNVEILRVDLSTKECRRAKDWVAEEKPLQLFIDGTFYASIHCSPSNLEQLAIGHLASEGILKSLSEIDKVNVRNAVCRVKFTSGLGIKRRLRLSRQFGRVILSACGVQGSYAVSRKLPKIKATLKVKANIILDCVKELNSAPVFRKTGGVHAAAIFKGNGTRVAFAEDIGRHNAVDKVVGIAMMSGTDLGNSFIVSTGRLTGDMVMKAATVKLPIVASVAAAIDSGIAVAKQVNLTLVGFVRGMHMNIYTRPERIIL
jgi:FdhD protein